MPGTKFESFGATVDVEAVSGEGVVTSGITSFMIKAKIRRVINLVAGVQAKPSVNGKSNITVKIGCSTKVTKCGFGSNHQTSQVMHGFQVPYHRSCLPYRVGFWVGPLGYSGPISFWGSFLAIFSHFLNGPGANKT